MNYTKLFTEFLQSKGLQYSYWGWRTRLGEDLPRFRWCSLQSGLQREDSLWSSFAVESCFVYQAEVFKQPTVLHSLSKTLILHQNHLNNVCIKGNSPQFLWDSIKNEAKFLMHNNNTMKGMGIKKDNRNHWILKYVFLGNIYTFEICTLFPQIAIPSKTALECRKLKGSTH